MIVLKLKGFVICLACEPPEAINSAGAIAWPEIRILGIFLFAASRSSSKPEPSCSTLLSVIIAAGGQLASIALIASFVVENSTTAWPSSLSISLKTLRSVTSSSMTNMLGFDVDSFTIHTAFIKRVRPRRVGSSVPRGFSGRPCPDERTPLPS